MHADEELISAARRAFDSLRLNHPLYSPPKGRPIRIADVCRHFKTNDQLSESQGRANSIAN
jgi:hypothetical protein